MRASDLEIKVTTTIADVDLEELVWAAMVKSSKGILEADVDRRAKRAAMNDQGGAA